MYGKSTLALKLKYPNHGKSTLPIFLNIVKLNHYDLLRQ